MLARYSATPCLQNAAEPQADHRGRSLPAPGFREAAVAAIEPTSLCRRLSSVSPGSDLLPKSVENHPS